MTSDLEATAIAEELDAVHRSAISHYRNMDARGYMEAFAPDLEYHQLNGVVIGRDQLARDVESQLSRLIAADTAYSRESLNVNGNHAVEHLVQTASATIRVFVFLRRTWRVRRTGRYTWSKTQEGWKIQKVEVIDERIEAA